MPLPLPLDLNGSSLADIARALAEKKLPPVAQWNPPHCGDSEMQIARDGTWFHQGSPIGRQELVRLFSTILRRETGGGYVLVTPAEKLDIAVEDAPFVAVELRADGEGTASMLMFRLNTGEIVAADADHGLRFAQGTDGPRPYLYVRAGLEALIARPVYYELVQLALAHENDVPGVWSAGTFFPIEPGA
ncbi:MAG: DUF1285 domain-containing protein [Sphingomonas sp.]|jgi:hypothetical protein